MQASRAPPADIAGDLTKRRLQLGPINAVGDALTRGSGTAAGSRNFPPVASAYSDRTLVLVTLSVSSSASW